MAKRIFTAFAIEDSGLRTMLTGQRLHTDTPFEWTDMSVKEPWDEQWKTNCRARIRGCNGVIGLITKNTANASGQLWELACSYSEGKPVFLIHGYSDNKLISLPKEISGRTVHDWTWSAIQKFIKGL